MSRPPAQLPAASPGDARTIALVGAALALALGVAAASLVGLRVAMTAQVLA